MWEQFLKKFLGYFFSYSIGFLIIGLWLFASGRSSSYVWIPFVFILTITASYSASKDIIGEYKLKCEEEVKLKERAQKDIIGEYKLKCEEEVKLKEQAQKEKELWKQSLIEKSAGYPTLLQTIDYYEKIKDEKIEQFLRYKSHPAIKAAEIVKEEAKRRRQAEYENKKTQAIIEYYESIAPFLVDLKNDIVDVDDEEKYRDYDEEEKLDPAIHYLTKEEFRKLPSGLHPRSWTKYVRVVGRSQSPLEREKGTCHETPPSICC